MDTTTIDVNKVLDATKLHPSVKHATIFGKFDALQSGESFILKNDHDPKPLHYHLEAMHGDTFTLTYLENGPEDWYIEISKK
jgi:regulator of cell morphogenesis and NO signaling